MPTISKEIQKLFASQNATPFLFIGSGLSRRYFGLDNWKELLEHFANEVTGNALAFEYYKNAATTPLSKSDLNIYPQIASLIENDFNKIWFSDKKFETQRSKYETQVKNNVSPFKINVCDYIDSKRTLNKLYENEIHLFSGLRELYVDGIITTNYDRFIETIFPNYKVYIGQNDLIFSNSQGIAEIYKIHGCVEKPETIILNHEDYETFRIKQSYLAAKLITIFMEHPVIFIGYSMNDNNIRNLLESISYCMDSEKLSILKERLLFVEWNNNTSGDNLSDYTIKFVNNDISMKHLFINDFSILYQALLDNRPKHHYNAAVLRRLKTDVYDIVLNNAPKAELIDLREDKTNENYETVIGIGAHLNVGLFGLNPIESDSVYKDIVFDNFKDESILKKLDMQEAFVKMCLPRLLRDHSYSIPVYKYIVGKDYKDLDDTIKRYIQNHKRYNDFFSEQLRKQVKDDLTIDKVIRSVNEDQQPTEMCLVSETNMDATKLHNFLKQYITKYPNVLKDKRKNIQIRRLIKLLDWMLYKKVDKK